MAEEIRAEMVANVWKVVVHEGDQVGCVNGVPLGDFQFEDPSAFRCADFILHLHRFHHDNALIDVDFGYL